MTDSRSYSTFAELSRYTASANSATMFDVQFTRDTLGRITQKIETIGGSTDTFVYTYDQAGRLTDVTKNGTLVSHYVYDSNGNRSSVTTQTGTVNGTYDAQDRLTQYGQLQFTYTANGELLTKSNPTLGQTANFSYDVLGNLKSANLPGSTTVEYVVDGQNRRIGKKVNGTLVQGFLYQSQLNPVAELDGTGAVVSRFVYGTKANVPDYMVKGTATYRIVSDHLGSPRLVINTGDGTVMQRIDYDEFGNITADTNPGFQPFGFASGLYDQHTGLTRFGVRDYDAQVGRWTAKDPIKFGSGNVNLYGYVLIDPVNYSDPTGLIAVGDNAVAGLISAGVSVLADIARNETNPQTIALNAFTAFGGGFVSNGLNLLAAPLVASFTNEALQVVFAGKEFCLKRTLTDAAIGYLGLGLFKAAQSAAELKSGGNLLIDDFARGIQSYAVNPLYGFIAGVVSARGNASGPD